MKIEMLIDSYVPHVAYHQESEFLIEIMSVLFWGGCFNESQYHVILNSN